MRLINDDLIYSDKIKKKVVGLFVPFANKIEKIGPGNYGIYIVFCLIGSHLLSDHGLDNFKSMCQEIIDNHGYHGKKES